MTALAELLQRLVTAKEWSRELDAALELLLPGVLPHPWDRTGYVISGTGHYEFPPGQGYLPSPYTVSLDAALALVERALPGQAVSILAETLSAGMWSGAVGSPGRVVQELALALCRSLLRALTAQEQSHG